MSFSGQEGVNIPKCVSVKVVNSMDMPQIVQGFYSLIFNFFGNSLAHIPNIASSSLF